MIDKIFSDFPNLETERLKLRKITLDDIEDMYSYCSNEEVPKYASWNAHNSLEETKETIERVINQWENKNLVHWGIEYKENRKLIGTIEFVIWDTQHKVAEIGYALSKDYWGMGFATEAASEVIKFGFNNMNLVRIQARCYLENIGSARVMEKAKMSFEGVIRKGLLAKGKHQDLKMYSIISEEFFLINKR
ncbi:GCN5 family acetyltransferase [Bacillus sp. FJAT-27225]|uniref:GNAT family N-acetyltransferase n=1 Tax=Bacillus sp. FJAT-27225 TaxID=1743144 RepID=UPI00080C2A4D|nr:GNAT family protein [Bacillus sp. FJAT-27225]OCA90365.1 GCN5 family acetyltransferase [Bacillus sp. FJAT-27225]